MAEKMNKLPFTELPAGEFILERSFNLNFWNYEHSMHAVHTNFHCIFSENLSFKSAHYYQLKSCTEYRQALQTL